MLSYGVFIIITPWSLAGLLSDWKRIVWNYKKPHINAIKANFLAHFQATGMCAFCHHTERNWTQPRCLFTWLLQISTTLQLEVWHLVSSTRTVIKLTILPTNLYTLPLMLVIRIWLHMETIFLVDDLIYSLGLYLWQDGVTVLRNLTLTNLAIKPGKEIGLQ